MGTWGKSTLAALLLCAAAPAIAGNRAVMVDETGALRNPTASVFIQANNLSTAGFPLAATADFSRKDAVNVEVLYGHSGFYIDLANGLFSPGWSIVVTNVAVTNALDMVARGMAAAAKESADDALAETAALAAGKLDVSAAAATYQPIGDYALVAALLGYVPITRTITFNGETQSLSQNVNFTFTGSGTNGPGTNAVAAVYCGWEIKQSCEAFEVSLDGETVLLLAYEEVDAPVVLSMAVAADPPSITLTFQPHGTTNRLEVSPVPSLTNDYALNWQTWDDCYWSYDNGAGSVTATNVDLSARMWARVVNSGSTLSTNPYMHVKGPIFSGPEATDAHRIVTRYDLARLEAGKAEQSVVDAKVWARRYIAEAKPTIITNDGQVVTNINMTPGQLVAFWDFDENTGAVYIRNLTVDNITIGAVERDTWPDGSGGGGGGILSSVFVDADWTWTNQIYAVGADTSATNVNLTLPDAGTNFTSIVVRKFSNLNQLRILRGTNIVYTLHDDGATRSYDWWPQRTNWYWRQ